MVLQRQKWPATRTALISRGSQLTESLRLQIGRLQMKDLYKEGKIFEKTEIWAEGLDRWMHLSAVAQFRWTICCKEPTIANSPGGGGGDATKSATAALYN